MNRKKGMVKLIYVHINRNERALPPETLYKSIHQVCMVSKSLHVIVLTNKHFIKIVQENINNIDKRLEHKIMVIPIELIYKDNEKEDGFRDNFWKYTTSRFCVIDAYLKEFDDNESFIHVENDIMVYTDITEMENVIKGLPKNKETESRIIKDSVNRGIGSVIYSNKREFRLFIEFILKEKKEGMNDMDLLGIYNEFNTLPIEPKESMKVGIWDGACIGQYLGGIDPRNIKCERELCKYENPSIGFINETSEFKPNTVEMIKKPVEDGDRVYKKYMIVEKNGFVPIHNLHIHSKHLAPFSSVFDIEYNEIISGDRIVSLVDIVLCTDDIYNYHKNVSSYNKNIVKIKDFRNIKKGMLKSIVSEIAKKRVKVFVYTHILDEFIEYILPIFETMEKKFVYYIHNSDYSFEERHNKLLEAKTTYRVYSQNINVEYNERLKLLPIGIANAMFNHGDLKVLYTSMCEMYMMRKTKNVFTSIEGRMTHKSRKTLMEMLYKTEYKNEMYKSLEYPEYIRELGKHYFALCPRGNGIDTHRFWEALYMGVIPILIETEETKMTNFINYIKEMRIPCYIVKDLCFFEMNGPSFFDKCLYNRIMNENKNFIQNLRCLKLRDY
jgi:hypothetical protein